MSKKIEIEIPEGKVAEWKEINGVTTMVLVDEVDNRPVTERIKTLEDACHELGEENVLVQAYRTAEFNTSGNQNDVSDVVAYLKLRVIAEALNEGWEPQFTKDEYRCYPLFYLYTQEEIDKMDEENKKKLWLFGGTSDAGASCGFAYANSTLAWSASDALISARLAVKSEALATYFGQQFIDIWADYITLPSKLEQYESTNI